jgi:pyruvate/2-oxoglutarate/acetoin dehydrogenase E1 component
MPGQSVDGMDVIAVHAAATEAVERARRGDGPTLLELVTYRYRGHSKSDKELYRTKDEVNEWRRKDPIGRLQDWLMGQDLLTPDEAAALDERAEAEIEAAIDYADGEVEPALSTLTDDVYYVDPCEADPERRLPEWAGAKLGSATPINPVPGSREITYAQALREAMHTALSVDEKVYMLGEDIGVYGGAFGVTVGLVDEFGSERVRDTPISENNIAGTAIGSGMTGMRPIAEMQFMDFVTLAMEQIVLQGAKIRYMFGGKAYVSMVLRLPAGSGTGAAAQHSQSLESLLVNVPGLKVVMPSTAYDAKGLLLAAIADNNPVMFVESKLLYKQSGPVPEDPYIVPLGKADVKRTGTDATLLAIGVMVPRALEAAEILAAEGIDVEVVDPRTLKPYDAETIIASVKKTGRLVIAHEAPLIGGYGGEMAGLIAQSEAFAYLEAPIVRLAGAETPPPYNRNLERAMVPQVENMVEAVRKLVNYEI